MIQDLVIIPARGGSKGIPGKNIKNLNGKPLIFYTLDAAVDYIDPAHICVSTDSDDIIRAVRKYGMDVPFKRPANLATDTAGTHEVVMHAIAFYENEGRNFDRIVLLQPTSPFRTGQHIKEAVGLYKPETDMVVSVKISQANPYFNLFEEIDSGYLRPSKKSAFSRRQVCPPVYEYNGAIYILNRQRLNQKRMSELPRVIKYIMSAEDSIDIDTEMDWIVADAILSNRASQGHSP